MSTPAYDPLPSDPRTALRDLSAQTRLSARIAALRLAVLRLDFPDAIVQIDPVRQDDTAIAIKATIGLPGGARHTAIAATDVDGATRWAQQYAETEAIAIARALDGLGQSLEVQVKSARQPTQPTQTNPPSQSRPGEEDHLPEYSWNAFWREANARGLTREQVEQALGRSVQEVTPREAVMALQSAGRW